MDEEVFHKAVHIVKGIAAELTTADYKKPTPCTEWDVQALFNHMTNELAWVGPLLRGKTIAEVGSSLDGDLIGDDPAGAWQKYADAAMKAAMAVSPDVAVHLSYGDKSAQDYVNEVGGDLIVHAWDLAKAIGAEYSLDQATADAVVKATADVMPLGRKGGLVGPEKKPASDTPVGKLMAYYGRDENWAPTAKAF